VTNRFVTNHLRYEKSNVIERCRRGFDLDPSFMREFAGDYHHHHPSNHGDDSAATAYTDDYYDAHERRLLIADPVDL
jgi:hypothetical protein